MNEAMLSDSLIPRPKQHSDKTCLFGSGTETSNSVHTQVSLTPILHCINAMFIVVQLMQSC